jgi:hypothetical protein
MPAASKLSSSTGLIPTCSHSTRREIRSQFRQRGTGSIAIGTGTRHGGPACGGTSPSIDGQTEVDQQIGAVVDLAAMHGVAVPRLQALLRIVHEAETGARSLGYANLDELVAIGRSLAP